MALLFSSLAVAGVASVRATAADDEYLTKAEKYLEEGQVSSALIEAKNAIQSDPQNPQARVLLGKINLRMGDAAAAEEAFLRARELGAKGDELDLLLAYARLAKGSFEDVARQAVTETDGLSATQRDLVAARGDALVALEKLDEAEEAYNRVLAEGNHAMALRGQATIALMRQQPEKSRELLDRALAMAPNNDEVVAADAEWYMRQGSYERARDRFAEAVELNPIKLVPRIGHVRALLGTGDVQGALAEITELRLVRPDDAMVAFQESVVQLAARNYEAAKKAADDALARDPYNTMAMSVAGSSAYTLALYEQAVAHLTSYLKAMPQDKKARLLLASTFLRLKETASVKTTLQPLLAPEPREARALALMAAAEALDGNTNAAAQYLEKASTLSEEDKVLRSQLGMVRVPAGDPTQGASDFDLFVGLAPSSAVPGDIGDAETTRIIALLKAGEFAAALENLQPLQTAHPDNAQLSTFAGIAHMGLGKRDSAEKTFAHAAELDPHAADARLNLARLQARDGKLDAARSLLDDVLAQQPDHYPAMVELAYIAGRAGDMAGAASWLEKAVAAQPSLPRLRGALAQLYLSNQQPQKALAAAEPALKQNPDSVELLSIVGQSQLQSGRAVDAITTFEKLVSVAPEAVDGHYQLAKAYGLAGKSAEMEAQLHRALELDPTHLPSQIALTRLLVVKGEIKEAEQRIQALKTTYPDNVEVMAQEGWMLLQQGRPEEAVRSLKTAVDRSGPNANRELVDSLARAHWAARQWDESLAVQEGWLAGHPSDVGMLMSVAQAYTQLARLEDATNTYRRVQAVQPDNVLALNNLAWLLRESAPEEALGHAERANALAPGTPSVMDTLAWLLLQRGDATRAVTLLEEAARNAPENPQYRYHLAQALGRAGQKEQAKQILQELLADERLEPEHAKIRRMLQQIGN